MKNKVFSIIFVIISAFIMFGNIGVVYAEDDKPETEFMNVDGRVSCGGTRPIVKNIPNIIPKITSSLYNAMMVIIPTAMIIMGLVDLIRGIMSQNEDEIKKGRSNFIKRLITGVITFLVVLLVKFFVGAFSNNQSERVGIVGCIDCFVSNQCVDQ